MSEDNPDPLRERRADKAKDAKLWTPLDALRAMIRDIENGSITAPNQIVIIYQKEGAKGENNTIGYYQAGLDRATHIALLEVHKYKYLKDWVEDR